MLLLAILAVWKRTGTTIPVEDIRTTRAEVLYGAAFLVANPPGTAAGDFLADELGLGCRLSARAISATLAAIVLAIAVAWESRLERRRVAPA